MNIAWWHRFSAPTARPTGSQVREQDAETLQDRTTSMITKVLITTPQDTPRPDHESVPEPALARR
jgi:hypothetical protein